MILVDQNKIKTGLNGSIKIYAKLLVNITSLKHYSVMNVLHKIHACLYKYFYLLII